VADKAKGNLALVFGGGDKAAPEGGPSSADSDEDLGLDSLDELAGGLAGEAEEAEAMPPDFSVHASEAFPELAGDDARLEALYRTNKACHPAV
jgi:hypothetical protein